MGRPFQTFEEWFQSDLKRMRNRTRWHYPQVPVYTRVFSLDDNYDEMKGRV